MTIKAKYLARLYRYITDKDVRDKLVEASKSVDERKEEVWDAEVKKTKKSNKKSDLDSNQDE